MGAPGRDPYEVLGVSSDASDEELRASYRDLAQRHHPDHNAGSPESARRFEEVQAAYQEIRERRARAPRSAGKASGSTVEPEVEARLADLEQQVRAAHAARERARREAQEAAAANLKRPSDEELGYVRTDDTLSQILADARVELSDRLDDTRGHPARQRVADLLDELAAKLRSRD